MNTITVPKSLLGGVLISLFALSLFAPTFQAQATVGVSCATSACSPAASCRSLTDNPATSPPAIEGGVCIGPCTINAECVPVKTALGWAAAKCTGSPAVVGPPAVPAVDGVCLETPRSGSSLPATEPAKTGEELLAVINTVTNWVFAIFTVLAIIFILLAAFQFVTAGGEAAKVGEARQKLIWAAVGIIVALLSKGLVPVIRAIVGG